MPSKTSIASAEKPAPPVILTSRPPPRVGDLVAPGLDRVDDPFALAVGLDVGGDDRRLAVRRADRADEGGVVGGLAGDRGGRRAAAGRQAFGAALGCRPSLRLAAGGGRCAVGDHAGEALLGHLADVFDDRAAVGGGQAGLAPEDDHRGGDFAFLQRLGRVERVGRFGVAGQVGGRLVAFGVFELARQVGGAGGDEDRHEPDREDDPLRAATGGEGEEGASHWSRISIRAGRPGVPAVGRPAAWQAKLSQT